MSNRFCNRFSDRSPNIFSNRLVNIVGAGRIQPLCTGRKSPFGDANIFLRLLSLDPNKGKRCADFPLCLEAQGRSKEWVCKKLVPKTKSIEKVEAVSGENV